MSSTWESGDDVGRIEVRFTPDGGSTVLTVDHVGHRDDAFWTEFGPGAVGVGWEMMLLGLSGHLGAPGVPTPDAAAAWTATPQAHRFVADSSARWAAAHVAAGADPAAAAASADRTTAAYPAVPDGAPGAAP